MRVGFFALVVLACVAPWCGAAAPRETLQEPWQQVYHGADLTGPHVIGCWMFETPQPGRDASGHGHDGVLEGATIDQQGRFGACLKSARGWPTSDTRHRLRVPDHEALSPAGAFAIELWLNADPELEGYPDSFLIDKKYVADTDYQLILAAAGKDGSRTLHAHLGFGNRSVTWYSEPIKVVSGTWYHLAFAYDGNGLGRFFWNGQQIGQRRAEGVGAIQAGSHPLSIGDRVGSYFHGFPGRIDQVRLTSGPREFGPLRIDRLSDRTRFVRMEPAIQSRFRIVNLMRSTIEHLDIIATLDGVPCHRQSALNVGSGKSCEVAVPIDTTLRPDEYQLDVSVVVSGEHTPRARRSFPIGIVARPLPDQFPVVMWGAGPGELERLRSIGFTHALGIGADYARIWQAKAPTAPGDPEQVAAMRQTLDQALGSGVAFAASLSPGRYLTSRPEFLRVDREGKTREQRPDICGLFPQIPKFCYNVGVSIARAYGDLPAFDAALLHTEIRDSAEPCFHPHDLAAYRQATGQDVPAAVANRWGVNYEKLPQFPQDHIIADDDPIYRYYRWYWREGDGWNGLNSALQRGLRQIPRKEFWTWFDPAARVASVYGSGGDVDVISQWTYSYPDPIRIGVATDELLTMARGAAHRQRVMKMTQIIWYRSQTAPQPTKPAAAGEYQARWERQQPDAPFITIAPMHLREAFWTMISRPITGIMYHGWQSLVPVDGQYGYRFTNPATRGELQRLIRTVVRPLGPTLLHVPGVKSDIAFYESFAAQMFARRGTYGWGGKWCGDAYQVLMWGGFQPDIVYDQTIEQHGLAGYKVLVMADCDVVTRTVADAILRFQKSGGIVVGDDHTAPGIEPDIVLSPYKRTGVADVDKKHLQQLAQQLRNELKTRYQRFVDSNNRDVIAYRRRFGKTDYVFLINDAREYGHYVGHHRLVMEDGLPSTATITVGRGSSYVYDLVQHRQVHVSATADRCVVPIHLGPCAGRLWMITNRQIDAVTLNAPKTVRRGQQAILDIAIVDDQGQTLDAVVPVRVALETPTTQYAEFSGYWAAINGKLRVPVDIAANDQTGTWTITVTELAGDHQTVAFIRVTGDNGGDKESVDPALADPVQPHG